jgi:hypothetical protein
MSAKAAFDNVHAALSKRLLGSKAMDESFFQAISESAATLSAPLTQEKIETTITKDGKRKVEVVEIGKRVETFQRLVEKEEAKLKENWKKWDEAQNEFLELGIELFGPEVFGGDAVGVKVRDEGFKREVELFNLEHNTAIGELDEEIEDNSAKILQKMKASEKVCNAPSYNVLMDTDEVAGVGCCCKETAGAVAASTYSRLILLLNKVCVFVHLAVELGLLNDSGNENLCGGTATPNTLQTYPDVVVVIGRRMRTHFNTSHTC